MEIMRTLVSALLCTALLGFVSNHALAQKAVGSERCGSCHTFAYEKWLKGPHAKAHASLVGDELNSVKCQICHSPGKLKDTATTFVGVQCESCHGNGQYYAHDYVMWDKELSRKVGLVDPTAATCTSCHTVDVPSLKPFSFEEYWKLIAHGREARLAWEARKAKLAK